jgi:hypothetical protein
MAIGKIAKTAADIAAQTAKKAKQGISKTTPPKPDVSLNFNPFMYNQTPKSKTSSSGHSSSTAQKSNSQPRSTSSKSSKSSKSSTGFTNLGGVDLGPVVPDDFGGGSGGTVDAGDNTLDIYALYAQHLAEQRAAAEESYQRNVNAINNAYGQARNYYDSNLGSTRDTLKSSYNASKGDIDSDAEASLREAYINNMLNRRNLQQALTAQGLNGGASETTQASMLNNYGSARNEIETQQSKNLSDLLKTYNDNLSSAQNAWSNQMASLELQKMQQLQQAENALNNMQTATLGNISTDSSYLQALQSLMKAQNAYELSPTTNSLLQSLTNTQQADYGALADTSYQQWLAQQQLQEAQQRRAMAEALRNPVISSPRLYYVR